MAICKNLSVIAAICGNFYQESTVNPGIWEGLTVGNPGFGLGQWTDKPPQVMRRTALFNWLNSNGYAQDSGDGQLNFLVYENVWIPSLITPSAYNTLTDFFNSTDTNINNLVYEFMYHWEGINDGSDTTRINAAFHFYDAFINDDGTRLPWFTGNYYLSLNAESTDNALRIKDFFLGSEPPTPPEPDVNTLIAIAKKLKDKKKIGGIHIYV